jgi:TATA-box binding protein (TBP) (component of TFIID and TFIIIB)
MPPAKRKRLVYVGTATPEGATFAVDQPQQVSDEKAVAAIMANVAQQKQSIVRTHNFVATCEAGKSLPLTPCAIALGGRYDDKMFPATVVKCQDTGAVNSIFGFEGSIVTVGAQSEDAALLTHHMLADAIFEVMGIDTTVFNFDMRNIVCSIELPYAIPPRKNKRDPTPETGGLNIELLLSDACSSMFDQVLQSPPIYVPEKFSGMFLEVKYKGFDMTIAMCATGSGVGTGLANRAAVDALRDFINKLPCYKRGEEYRKMTEAELMSAAAKRACMQQHKTHSPDAVAERHTHKRARVLEQQAADLVEEDKKRYKASIFQDDEQQPTDAIKKEEEEEEETTEDAEASARARFFPTQ